jgi:NAD(P)-dependent dehydrogenase (short-subunit alcohol dehydrogenase family)
MQLEQPMAPRSNILVTGTSSGFGELIVKTLAADGHRVFATMRGIAARNAAPAAELRRWAADGAVDVEIVELDVTSDTSVRNAVRFILESAGTIDVVVNNAGGSAVGPLEAFGVDQMAALLSLNALGPMRVNKAVLPGMRARRSGLIIWITSTLGRVLPGRGGLYPASKWAAEGLAETLHHQVAGFGIDVAILEPGSFPSQASFKSMVADDQDIAGAYAGLGPPAGATTQQTPPPDHRPPDPQEVADAVKRLIDLPAGQRPLRTVVGPVFTDGVAEYNLAYERLRSHMEEVLRRPDQVITWTRRTP